MRLCVPHRRKFVGALRRHCGSASPHIELPQMLANREVLQQAELLLTLAEAQLVAFGALATQPLASAGMYMGSGCSPPRAYEWQCWASCRSRRPHPQQFRRLPARAGQDVAALAMLFKALLLHRPLLGPLDPQLMGTGRDHMVDNISSAEVLAVAAVQQEHAASCCRASAAAVGAGATGLPGDALQCAAASGSQCLDGAISAHALCDCS